jgi:hypothetical protein
MTIIKSHGSSFLSLRRPKKLNAGRCPGFFCSFLCPSKEMNQRKDAKNDGSSRFDPMPRFGQTRLIKTPMQGLGKGFSQNGKRLYTAS